MVGDGDAPTGGLARRRAHMPDGTREILDFRSLGADQRRLAALLRPRLAVLAVGCGTGAIPRGVPEAVGPDGRAVGVDVNPSMIEAARAAHRRVPGLAFYVVDVYALPFRGEFDIVATARVLQWLPDTEAPLAARSKGVRR